MFSIPLTFWRDIPLVGSSLRMMECRIRYFSCPTFNFHQPRVMVRKRGCILSSISSFSSTIAFTVGFSTGIGCQISLGPFRSFGPWSFWFRLIQLLLFAQSTEEWPKTLQSLHLDGFHGTSTRISIGSAYPWSIWKIFKISLEASISTQTWA